MPLAQPSPPRIIDRRSSRQEVKLVDENGQAAGKTEITLDTTRECEADRIAKGVAEPELARVAKGVGPKKATPDEIAEAQERAANARRASLQRQNPDEKPLDAAHSLDERRYWAAENLERRLVKHGGLSAEQAHQRAAEVARETDKRNRK